MDISKLDENLVAGMTDVQATRLLHKTHVTS